MHRVPLRGASDAVASLDLPGLSRLAKMLSTLADDMKRSLRGIRYFIDANVQEREIDDYAAGVFPRHDGKLDAIVASAGVALERRAYGRIRGSAEQLALLTTQGWQSTRSSPQTPSLTPRQRILAGTRLAALQLGRAALQLRRGRFRRAHFRLV